MAEDRIPVHLVHEDPTQDHLSQFADEKVVEAAVEENKRTQEEYYDYEAARQEIAEEHESSEAPPTTTFGSPDTDEDRS